MTCRHCDPEERERLRKDDARWFARIITRKDRESLKGLVRLMDDLNKDIEAAEAERGDK